MSKCECYWEEIINSPRYDVYTGSISHYVEIKRGRCNGTREQDECSCGGDCVKCDFYPNVREKALNELQPKFSEWISVKDRLPTIKENNKDFLCRCILDGANSEEYAYYLVLKWYIYDARDDGVYINPHFQDDGCNGMSVTHWMPLPEPPQEERGSK